jgi:thiamine biosynthesis lipoprotein
MGSRCRLLLRGGPQELAQSLIDRVHELESRWTRFRPDSEVSRLNGMAGYHVFVGSDTMRLLLHAQAGWRMTGGWFDPLMLDELEAAGYERTHDELDIVHPADPHVPAQGLEQPRRSPMNELIVDEALHSITLPAGTRFDPGGVGKGLAADMVTEDAIAAGADSVLIELGGDLRLHGPWHDGETWPALVSHPIDPDRELAELVIAGGALATSGRRRRRWRTSDGGEAHHLLDPRTGLPSNSDLEAVTVHAGTAWYAEVIAKAALLAGSGAGRELIDQTETAALFVQADGTIDVVGPLAIRRLEP